MNLPEILSQIIESLRENQVPAPVIKKVVSDIEKAAEEEKEEKAPRAARSKGQVVILALEPDEVTGFALQIEENGDPATVIGRISEAARSFNRTKRGSKNPVKSVQETLEAVKGKHWKVEGSASDGENERKTKVLTREPVQIISISGKLE